MTPMRLTPPGLHDIGTALFSPKKRSLCNHVSDYAKFGARRHPPPGCRHLVSHGDYCVTHSIGLPILLRRLLLL